MPATAGFQENARLTMSNPISSLNFHGWLTASSWCNPLAKLQARGTNLSYPIPLHLLTPVSQPTLNSSFTAPIRYSLGSVRGYKEKYAFKKRQK